MYHKILAYTLLLLVMPVLVMAQTQQKKVIINWKGIQQIQGINYENINALVADGLSNDPAKNYTPAFFEKLAMPAGAETAEVLVSNTKWEPVSNDQIKLLSSPLVADEVLTPITETGTERGRQMLMLSLNPIVVNPEGGLMRLTSFTIDIVYKPAMNGLPSVKATSAWAAHSVLSTGNWYKVNVQKSGIHKLTYSDIQAMGVNMANLNPSNIRLFGNGGGMLPEANSSFRYDDLTENPISVITAVEGVFAPGDYILFYGTAPTKVYYNKVTHKFEHSQNIYSDVTSYFLNFDGGAGLRIQVQEQTDIPPTYTCTSFTEGVYYENDLYNFINSGKDWAGERMDGATPTFELPAFTFPNLISGKQSWIRFRVTARATTTTKFNVKVNGTTVATPSVSSYNNYDFANDRIETKSFFPETNTVNVGFEYTGGGTAIGWLDWVELNIPREMKFTGGQLAFADPFSVMPGTICDFRLQSNADVTIWEVTNPLNVKKVNADFAEGVVRFVLPTDSIRQFVAWDNTQFYTPVFAGKLVNQDLHSISSADLLIVTPDEFLTEANRLAEHHRIVDGLTVAVATNQQIYNEFSSGVPDICAIRDFAAMLYHRPDEGYKLRYLLLFGDGSFDFKGRVPTNTNKVLTFQTNESLNSVYSFASDDFFGILDPKEGNDATGLIDIGIGRFPVNTEAEAKLAVDKSIFYATNSEANMGDWRNKLCFAADDGNGNTHFRQVEKQIIPLIKEIGQVYNVNKVYIDAYKQVSTPGGQRCPDANTAIGTNVENGVLVMNYTGHGGETGWADEGILTVQEIDSWTNYDNMPVFMTATCEFSRYDDPNRISAGEHVFLNPVGGGIALFTTTRLANAGTNIGLTIYFYDTLFSKTNGEYPRFGDVIAHAKNKISSSDSKLIRNFVLLGDPALRLAYPKYNVITTHINGLETGSVIDTISAMTPVEIKGIVADESGNKLSGFNGTVDVKVFDKERTLTTLGSEPGDWPDTYTVQDNYIYQGKATVTNGDFTVNFIVPRDIDYSYGLGKISYYASDATTDATGYSKDLIIGGSGNESSDNEGPEISLYMDNLDFESGDIVGPNPWLIARLTDENGINTISNAIGHDIVATLDGDNSASIVLNSFYNSDIDSYKSGEVRYRFQNLKEGSHTLSLKAWDVFNNSSVATITFTVTKNMQIIVTNITTYPNPFTNEIKVGFEINLSDIPVEAHLEIFNMNGQLVSVTDKEILLAQGYIAGELKWDGRNASGEVVTPGVYIVSVRASNGNSETVKAVRVLKIRE